MRSYSEEIDTIAVINSLTTDTLSELEASYYERTLSHERIYGGIDTSYTFPTLDFSHYPIPFMTPEMEMGDSSVLVVVDEITFQNISPYLMRYASDIYYGTNYDVYIERFVL